MNAHRPEDASPDLLARADWPAHSERLLLRRATADDVDAVWAFRRLPEVGRWLGWHPEDHDDFRRRYSAGLSHAIVVEPGGEIIADLVVKPQDGWAQREVAPTARGTEAELGWSMAPHRQGNGYATEAVRALLALCFGPLGLRRVTAGAFLANEPSWRLMERVGMRRESLSVQDALHREFGWMDGVLYALLAVEFGSEEHGA